MAVGGDRRTVSVSGGANLSAETFGSAGDAEIVLCAGGGSSMDWWDPDFCSRLAAAGRFVARFDQRDTGLSTTYPPGDPGYTGAEMAADIGRVIEELARSRAHVIGMSMGGAAAQRLALERPDLVETLTLISTTSIEPTEGLPGMRSRLEEAFSNWPETPDWSDRDAVIEHLVAVERPFASANGFEEDWMRKIAAAAFDRGARLDTAGNHEAAESGPAPTGSLGDLTGTPTLVVHGTEDPCFPLPHGEALAAAIEGSRLLRLEGIGHETAPPRAWDVLVPALIEHTRPVA